LEVHVNGVIVFLYPIDKMGEVHNGRPNPDINGNVPERWG
jgi:hypothetical protein